MSTDTVAALKAALQSATSIEAIGALLDAADGHSRRVALESLSKTEQSALYDRAAAGPVMTLEDLVPPTTGALIPVVHHGKNSLPAFRVFQKVVCRPDDGSPRVFGFNEGSTRKFIGPGYFVATATADVVEKHPAWAERGGVVVDYFQVPDVAVAPGWPAVVPNEAGLQRFVFRGTRDFLRRVSSHACIGAAWRGETPFNSWFVLCRD